MINLTSNRITQVLLLALIATQVPAAYNLLTKYPSKAAALRACNAWLHKGGKITYGYDRTSKYIRQCGAEDNQVATWSMINATDGEHFKEEPYSAATSKSFRF